MVTLVLPTIFPLFFYLLSEMSASCASTNCFLCERYRGKKGVIHDAKGCPYRAGVKCRRCNHRGHIDAECTATRCPAPLPSTLEELIPADKRLLYKITTHTPFTVLTQTEAMIPDVNRIVVPDYSDYKELGAFMKKYGISVDEKVTKDPKKERIAAIKKWGVSHGYRLVQEVSIASTGVGTGTGAGAGDD